MSYRFMRIMVFFDLPTETLENRRDYSRFRKFLIKSGFMMVQESVYCKLALNQTVVASITESVRRNKPSNGLVQLLVITEKQYSKMEFITGTASGDIITTDERFIEL